MTEEKLGKISLLKHNLGLQVVSRLKARQRDALVLSRAQPGYESFAEPLVWSQAQMSPAPAAGSVKDESDTPARSDREGPPLAPTGVREPTPGLLQRLREILAASSSSPVPPPVRPIPVQRKSRRASVVEVGSNSDFADSSFSDAAQPVIEPITHEEEPPQTDLPQLNPEILPDSSANPPDQPLLAPPLLAVGRPRSITPVESSFETYEPIQVEEAEDLVSHSDDDGRATAINTTAPSGRNSEGDTGASPTPSVEKDKRISPGIGVQASDVEGVFPPPASSTIVPELPLRPVTENVPSPAPSRPGFHQKTILPVVQEASEGIVQREEQPKVSKSEKRRGRVSTKSDRSETSKRGPAISKPRGRVAPKPATELSVAPAKSPAVGTSAQAPTSSVELKPEPETVPKVDPSLSVLLSGKVESAKSEPVDKTSPDPLQDQFPELEVRPLTIHQPEIAKPSSQARQQTGTTLELEEIPSTHASEVTLSGQTHVPIEPAPTISRSMLTKPAVKPAGPEQATTATDKAMNQETAPRSSIASITRAAEQTDFDQTIDDDIEEIRSPGPPARIMRDPVNDEPSFEPDQLKPVTVHALEPNQQPEDTRSSATPMTNNLGGGEEKPTSLAANPGSLAINQPEPEAAPTPADLPAPVVTQLTQAGLTAPDTTPNSPNPLPATNPVTSARPVPESADMKKTVQLSDETPLGDGLSGLPVGPTVNLSKSTDINRPILNEVEATSRVEKSRPRMRLMGVDDPQTEPDYIDRPADLQSADQSLVQQDQQRLQPPQHTDRDNIHQTVEDQPRSLNSDPGRPTISSETEPLIKLVDRPRQPAAPRSRLDEQGITTAPHGQSAPTIFQQKEINEGIASSLTEVETTLDQRWASEPIPEQTSEPSLMPTRQTVLARLEDPAGETVPLPYVTQTRPETSRLRLDEIFGQRDIEVEPPETIQRSPDGEAGSAPDGTPAAAASVQPEAEQGQKGVAIETMARQVYQILRRRLMVEKERYRG